MTSRPYNIANIIRTCAVNWRYTYLNELFHNHSFKFKLCGINSSLEPVHTAQRIKNNIKPVLKFGYVMYRFKNILALSLMNKIWPFYCTQSIIYAYNVLSFQTVFEQMYFTCNFLFIFEIKCKKYIRFKMLKSLILYYS